MAKYLDTDETEDKKPICREERQYALFLYNKLKAEDKYYVGKFRKWFNIPDNDKVEIIDVYYEASFMRDFFCEDRIQAKTDPGFNKKLFEFLYKEKNMTKPDRYLFIHVNHWKIKNGSKKPLLMRCMMNAKPDIAVWYKVNEIDHLSFIECKFESKESKYHLDNNKKISQTDVQRLILLFLCGSYNGIGSDFQDVINSYHVDVNEGLFNGVKAGGVKIIKFTRGEETEVDNEINIGKLMNLRKSP